MKRSKKWKRCFRQASRHRKTHAGFDRALHACLARSFGAVTPRDLFDWKRDAHGNRYIPADGGRARLKRKTEWKALRSDVRVIRTGGTGDKAFQACIQIGGLLPGRIPTGGKTASSFSHACMFGRNPRAALVSALSRAVRQIKKRQGAFAGVR